MMAVAQQPGHKTLAAVLTDIISLPSEYDVVIKDLKIDSRLINSGDLFIAINGETVNGIDYIDTAIEAGAAAVVWDAQADVIPFALSTTKRIPLIAIPNLKEKLASMATHFYSIPSKYLDIVAVTGTNGKTSCVNYIAQALTVTKKCGVIGTLGSGIYPDFIAGTHTTPDIFTMHKILADFVKQDTKYAAIEVSSHALAQGRIGGVDIDTAIFTNLTQDHLDYHGTMGEYLKEKEKLFKLAGLKTAIVNINDPYGSDIVQAAAGKKIITYGIDQMVNSPEIYASNIQYYSDRSEFLLNTKEGSINIISNLVGDFNVSNLLAVCAYLLTKKYSLENVSQRISNVNPVAGRMQQINAKGFPVVIIDYAHTPDALKQVLMTLSAQYKGNLTCVFGCGGERDKEKRSQMGKVADSYANKIILTNDNPRSESEKEIVKQIISGIKEISKVFVELDRKKAIINAISNTQKEGCVLIAGKGHETYQIIGNTKLKFSDASVVKEILNKL